MLPGQEKTFLSLNTVSIDCDHFQCRTQGRRLRGARCLSGTLFFPVS